MSMAVAALAGAVLVVAGCASYPAAEPAAGVERSLGRRLGPDYLYPNPTLTPGRADTLTLGNLTARFTRCPNRRPSCTYSQLRGDVPSDVRRQVYDEYAVAETARNSQSGEIDHLVPVCAGGSNDIRNLWYQPAINTWNGRQFGFHEKDDLEAWICRQILAGALDPHEAYHRITTDWVAYFLDVRPPQRRNS